MYDASAQNEPILYYTVYFSGYDGISFCGDLLHEVRKCFFESAREMKDKGVHDFNGASIHYAYSMQASKPLKWHVTSGLFKILERCIVEKNSSYYIETLDKAGKTSKRTYYSANHIWEETRYYDPSDGFDPVAKIQPWSMGNTLLFTKYDPESGEGLAYDLIPAGEVSDDELTKRVNAAAGTPSVWCRTSLGDFYYCRRDEADKRLNLIKNIKSSIHIVQPPVMQSKPENTWVPPAPAAPVQEPVPKINRTIPAPFDTAQQPPVNTGNDVVDISTMQSGLDEALRRSAIEMERVMHPQHDPVVYAFNPEIYSAPEPVEELNISEPEEDAQQDALASTLTEAGEPEQALRPENEPYDTGAVIQEGDADSVNTADIHAESLQEKTPDETYEQHTELPQGGMQDVNDFATEPEDSAQNWNGLHFSEETSTTDLEEDTFKPDFGLQLRQEKTDFSTVDSEIENLFTHIEASDSTDMSSDIPEFNADIYSPHKEGEPIAYFEEPQEQLQDGTPELGDADDVITQPEEPENEEISAQGLIIGMGFKPDALQDVRKYSVAGSSMIRSATEEKIASADENTQQDSVEPPVEDIAQPAPVEELSSQQEETQELAVEPVQPESRASEEPEQQDIEPKPYLNSRGEFPYTMQSACGAAAEGCPYSETPRKKIIISADETYYYFGDVVAGLREGRGRTIMQNGFTAYEGEYQEDKRSGFGTYYYKSGKVCYVGEWKDNRRSGTGVSFRPTDGTIHVGRWEEDHPVGMGSRFDCSGNLVFAGQWENGKRQGAGISYRSEDGRVFIGKWKDDMPAGLGTEFDGEGNLLYTGTWQEGMRHGEGTEYDKNGKVLYKGEFSYGMYDGDGAIHLSDGRRIEGHFSSGYVSGTASEISADGFKLYEGEWQDGTYFGEGRRYLRSGGWYQGRFEKGLPTGRLSGFDGDGRLCYQGEWDEDLYNGQGCRYVNGDKVYEGHFTDGLYNGQGFEYEHGSYVYSGSYANGVRSGFGTSFKNGKPEYAGMWSENLYNGPGVLYQDGVPQFAGLFSDGKKDGRINEIRQNQIFRECLFENDRIEYMREYGPGGVPVYEGKVLDGLRHGMGCTFTPFCEKHEEGIFEKGCLITRMKVSFTPIEPLPYAEELSHTEYEHFRKGSEFVLEQSLLDGVYSGLVHEGVPNGTGTILYADHRYTGGFADGKPCGQGTIYYSDGHTLSGEFTLSMSSCAQRLGFANGVEYFLVKNAAPTYEPSVVDRPASPSPAAVPTASADFMKDLYESWRRAHNL